MLREHTPGPWVFTKFNKPNGDPITDLMDIGETMGYSAGYSDRLELFGVTLNDADEEGRSTVVCYTGNGPNAHNNARLIASAPELLEALKGVLRIADRNTVEFDAARAAIIKAQPKE